VSPQCHHFDRGRREVGFVNKSAIVLGVPHQIQGPGFQSYVEDQSYPIVVKALMHEVDFVFEEAAGHGPSIAQQLAASRQAQYLDIDPPGDQRPLFGIERIVGGGWPVDPVHSAAVCECSKVEEQRKREELWLHSILSKPFQKGLVIVGLAHNLSFSFRLMANGVTVEKSHQYIPYDTLCTGSHD
jgi:hypothetical protein